MNDIPNFRITISNIYCRIMGKILIVYQVRRNNFF